jgi:hypothetical protein
MPWNVSDVVEQRSRFLDDYDSDAYSMAELCRMYEISRQTGCNHNRLRSRLRRRTDKVQGPHHSGSDHLLYGVRWSRNRRLFQGVVSYGGKLSFLRTGEAPVLHRVNTSCFNLRERSLFNSPEPVSVCLAHL